METAKRLGVAIPSLALAAFMSGQAMEQPEGGCTPADVDAVAACADFGGLQDYRTYPSETLAACSTTPVLYVTIVPVPYSGGEPHPPGGFPPWPDPDSNYDPDWVTTCDTLCVDRGGRIDLTGDSPLLLVKEGHYRSCVCAERRFSYSL